VRNVRIIAAAALVALALAIGGGAALAQTGQGAQTFTLEPGGRATITCDIGRINVETNDAQRVNSHLFAVHRGIIDSVNSTQGYERRLTVHTS
jgi:hypothetical protein